MRKDPLITGSYYHIYNRGVDKRDIFANKKDLIRFIKSVKQFNRVKPVGSIEKINTNSVVGQLNPLVSIVCYCFNPNHFHFILKQEVDGGISEFLKRLQGGYTNYFNISKERSGSLFQGRFKSKLINDDQYFLKIRPYVHLNYLIHNIDKEKSDLIYSSEKEYDSFNFNLVSKKEAEQLIGFYGNNINFKKEALNVVSIIREERGTLSLLDEESLDLFE